MRKVLRFSSGRFVPRNDYTYPELHSRLPQVSRTIRLAPVRREPRIVSGVVARPGDLRR